MQLHHHNLRFLIAASALAAAAVASGQIAKNDVLFEDEVNPSMSAALDNGLEVTALHNHFLFDQPKVYFMHIAGMGDLLRAKLHRS